MMTRQGRKWSLAMGDSFPMNMLCDLGLVTWLLCSLHARGTVFVLYCCITNAPTTQWLVFLPS